MSNQDEAVNQEAVQQNTDVTDSAPVKTNSSEEADDFDIEDSFDDGQSFDDGEESEEKQEQEPEKEEEPEKPDPKQEKEESDSKPRGAEKRKEQLNGEIDSLKQELGIDPSVEIRDLVSARNYLKEQVGKANADVYQPVSQEELMGQVNPETNQPYTALEAKWAAFEQQQEMKQYTEQVAEAQLTLQTEATRALKEFPMFDPESSEYMPEVASQVDRVLGESLIYDENTKQVIGSHMSPYSLYKSYADAIKFSSAKGEAKAAKNRERQMANVDPSANTHQSAKTDDELDAFEKEANRW